MTDIPRLDLRQRRAEVMANGIMKELDDFIAPALQREAYRKILDLLCQSGVEILTDFDRHQMGLPERDNLGWTKEEVAAFEAAKLEAMTRPLTITVPMPGEKK